MKVYSLYLSTLSPAGSPYAPIYDTPSVVSWNINWDAFFGSHSANNSLPNKCRVKFLLTSQSGTLTYNNTLGSLRANFTSPYANNYNGVNIGDLHAVNDPTNGTDHRYLGDTTSSIGVDIALPRGNQELQLRFVSLAEAILNVTLDYQVWLYFEVEEHEK